MERHIYTYQSDVTPLYYPLEYSDLSWDPAKVPANVIADPDKSTLMRDYANVTISMSRMDRYVRAGERPSFPCFRRSLPMPC